MTRKIFHDFPLLLFEWWWVFAFILLCMILYEEGLRARNKEYRRLEVRFNELVALKQKAAEMQHELHLQIGSHQDPDWIELTLMKELGVVPEGQVKVFFFP